MENNKALPAPMQAIAEMTVEQLFSKKDSLERDFEFCRQTGQGVSTKERVWYQFVLKRLVELEQLL